MKHAYDMDDASKLVPLLESIFQEVADRRLAIRDMEKTLVALKRQGAPADEIAPITAKLAVHRRELRHTRAEFERLGCVVDEHNPNRVVIPGAGGDLDVGYAWEAGESGVRSLTTEETVF
ncbi:MAG: DUF2203 family protein [Planctomycetota bacterium]